MKSRPSRASPAFYPVSQYLSTYSVLHRGSRSRVRFPPLLRRGSAKHSDNFLMPSLLAPRVTGEPHHHWSCPGSSPEARAPGRAANPLAESRILTRPVWMNLTGSPPVHVQAGKCWTPARRAIIIPLRAVWPRGMPFLGNCCQSATGSPAMMERRGIPRAAHRRRALVFPCTRRPQPPAPSRRH